MTRSRQRKLQRDSQRKHLKFASAPLAAAVAAVLSTPAMAQQSEEGVLENVIVTAQKRSENLQEVPLSIQALGSEQLEELHIQDFEDYVRYLPTVSYQTFGPGFAQVYMRGVASGGDGNHSGSLPSVGVYLDEQPITTIQGALDVHLYDIARVEALAGPQGTLYGASSQAGTLRIITNKPDASEFSAGYDLEGSTMSDGGSGYLAEGFANIPLTPTAAVRLVGWKRHDPGFIDNVSRPRTFPSSVETGIGPLDDGQSEGRLQRRRHDRRACGAEARPERQLDHHAAGHGPGAEDAWHVRLRSVDRRPEGLASVPGEVQGPLVPGRADGRRQDRQSRRHVRRRLSEPQGRHGIGLLRLLVLVRRRVLRRCARMIRINGLFGTYFYDDDGGAIDISQYIQGKDRYTRWTHELRFATPAENRWRFVGGVFTQRQTHDIEQRYLIDDLATDLSVTGWDDTLWLTEQERIDRDNAIFGELSFDITDKLTATGGIRYFEAENSLEGFFGFGDGFSGSGKYGETLCSDLVVRADRSQRATRRAGCRSSTRRARRLARTSTGVSMRRTRSASSTWRTSSTTSAWCTRPGRAATGRAASTASAPCRRICRTS